uniref:Ppfibp1_0 protein n=1 Tax=Fopius arisanus TaxID=64838 RepID=A0A0C9RNY1_9HYME
MMEGVWTNGCVTERQDLDPILEEDDKSHPKDSDSSDATSTVKRWDCRWTPSEAYDSDGTSSTSERGYTEDYPREMSGDLPAAPRNHEVCRSQGCLCQNCLLGYARSIALHQSIPNVCTGSSNIHHVPSHPQLTVGHCITPIGDSCDYRNANHHLQSGKNQPNIKDQVYRGNSKTSSTVSLSLDRRRRRLRNRNDRDQRARSQSDLLYCDHERSMLPHYCSLQQFQCHYGSNPYMNYYNNNTEERLRKLENERAGLHMEVSVLSEQVDAQSSKILELENILQEKKDAMRQMEDVLQKEVLSRSALETQKLELLTSLSEMKLRQASLEHENVALRSATSISNVRTTIIQ